MKEKKIVCALLVNGDNQILIQDRKAISKYWEEWSFFWGGIDEDESPENALKRELSEELDWIPEKYMFIWETENFMKEQNMLYHRYVYLVSLPNRKEWTDLEWSGAHFFHIEEIRSLKFNTPIESELLLLYDNL